MRGLIVVFFLFNIEVKAQNYLGLEYQRNIECVHLSDYEDFVLSNSSYLLTGYKGAYRFAYGLEIQGKELNERSKVAMSQIESVGLQGFENQYPSQLSGGMQQRVGLARALATNPGILLMDEAFSALDPLIRSDMQKQLIDLQSELKKTIVFITHDLDESLKLGDHIGILNGGRLVQVGTPIDIIMNPADDYVKAFVKDVNRAKVIKAKIIMISKDKLEKNGIID